MAGPGREAGFEGRTRSDLRDLVASELGGVVLGRTLLSDVGVWVSFLAREPNEGDRVVLNVRPRESLDDTTLTAVFDAADRNRDVRHPDVLSVRRYGRTDRLVWVTTSGAGGRVLGTSMSPPKGDPRERALEFLRLVARPLSALHEAGLVHGALSRPCVHVDAAGRARLRNIEVDVPILRANLETGLVTEATACAAPEVRRGEPPRAESDQYALAALVVQALTGRIPEPEQLVRSGIPDSMRRGLLRALSLDPSRRFPSVGAFWEAIDRAGRSRAGSGGQGADARDEEPWDAERWDLPEVPADGEDDWDIPQEDLPAGAGSSLDPAPERRYVASAFRPRETRTRVRRGGESGAPPTARTGRRPGADLLFDTYDGRYDDEEPRGNALWGRALTAALLLLLASGGFELFVSEARFGGDLTERLPDASASVDRGPSPRPDEPLAPTPAGGETPERPTAAGEDPVAGGVVADAGAAPEGVDAGSDARQASASPAESTAESTVQAPPEPPADARPADRQPNRASPDAGTARTRQATSTAPPPDPPMSGTTREVTSGELFAAPGLLSLQTYPWGAVYLDGGFVGNSPLVDVRLAPGTHTIRIERPGYESYERELTVEPGRSLRLTGIVLRQTGE